MKVKLTKTGRIAVVNASFGNRLIEQGRAVFVPEDKPKETKKPARKAGETDGAERQD